MFYSVLLQRLRWSADWRMDHRSCWYADANSNVHTYNYSYSYCYCYTDGYRYANGYSDGDSHCHCYSYCHSNSDGYRYGDGYTDCDTAAYSQTKIESATETSPDSSASSLAGGDAGDES